MHEAIEQKLNDMCSHGNFPENCQFCHLEKPLENHQENDDLAAIAFKKFISLCDEREKQLLFRDHDGRVGYQLAAMFLGLKPVMMSLGPLSYRLAKNNSDFTIYGVLLVNTETVLRVIQDNPEVFDDFDLDRARDSSTELGGYKLPQPAGEMYFHGYLQKLKQWERSTRPEEIVRAGLLYGYPKEAVIAISQGRGSLVFDSYGYQFMYDESSGAAVEHFRQALKQLLKKSGLEEYIKIAQH